MKHNKTKKTLLGVGTAVLAPAVTMLVQGNTVEGGLLMVIGVGMIVVYDHLDDKAKGNLPSGVDEETVKEIADLGADGIRTLKEQYDSRTAANISETPDEDPR